MIIYLFVIEFFIHLHFVNIVSEVHFFKPFTHWQIYVKK